MDHRIDKNEFIINQLQSCPSNIQISRFSGLNIQNFFTYNVHNYIMPGSQMHKGIMGCWMSHKNCIKNYIEQLNNGEWVLILEDDIFIDSNFWGTIIIFDPPQDSDMIFFDSIKDSIDAQYIVDSECNVSKIYTSWPFFAGTHCYAIKNSSLNKIYNILDGVTIFKDIDGFLFDNNNIIKYNYDTGLIKINYNFQSDRLTPL